MKSAISIISLVAISLFVSKPMGNALHFNDGMENFSILDSLKKFEGSRDTLLLDDANDATLFIGTTKGRHYGVYVISEKTLAFYQKKHNWWELTEQFPYEYLFSYAEAEDINGDGTDDIKVACLSGSAGNSESTIFLYDIAAGSFKHNKFYDLPNVAYDKKGKFIRSSWYAGAMHCQSKYKYRITGDSLTFDKGVSFCPNHDDMKKGIFIEYTQKGDDRIVIDSINGNPDKLWNRFEKSFWDSEHDME